NCSSWVKVVWTREEDIQHDMYRPYWFDRLSAGLDEKGMPTAWSHRFAGSSVLARWAPPFFRNGLDPDTTEGALSAARRRDAVDHRGDDGSKRPTAGARGGMALPAIVRVSL